MVKRFDKLNDYELLYLIKDGNEKALDYMMYKYDIYIYKICSSLYGNRGKLDDLLQEGRMILFSCIQQFNDSYNISFYVYFSICLKRALYKLISNSYYSSLLLNEEQFDMSNYSASQGLIYSGSFLLKDSLMVLLYEECIIGGMSMKDFSRKYNIEYNKVRNAYKATILLLKKLFCLD